MVRALSLGSALTLLFAASCTKPKPAAVKNACIPDVLKFCKDVKRGGGRIIRCLEDHAAELSEPCQALQAERRERLGLNKTQTAATEAAPAACGIDQKPCADEAQTKASGSVKVAKTRKPPKGEPRSEKK
jgi:hypothetical protein